MAKKDGLYKDQPRTTSVGMKVSIDEKRELEKYCSDKGFSVSRFMRHSVLEAMKK